MQYNATDAFWMLLNLQIDILQKTNVIVKILFVRKASTKITNIIGAEAFYLGPNINYRQAE